MNLINRFYQRKNYKISGLLVVILFILALWKPYALIYGIQRGSLYALIALPLSLSLGVIGILNLAHGDFLTLGAYLAYWICIYTGADPLLTIIPVLFALFLVGYVIYKLAITHVLKASPLNQLLLTFGFAMILEESINFLWSSQPRNIYVSYASTSTTIGSFTFGTYEFIYSVTAIIILVSLLLFLKRTRMGQAAFAVGQNSRGAKLVGIDVERTYLFIFSLSIAILGIVVGLMLPRASIFPMVGAPFTMKSFCLVAMAGLGNLTAIFWSGIALGYAEALVQSFKGYGGWADIVFFIVLIIVISIKSYRRQSL
ncbi:MAG: branched-chain amino acid ABC transporter permease [Chloroflexi bacterium]|nr:branched-chain amino acid ABC transporter permease [Chloroflexota bacterium]